MKKAGSWMGAVSCIRTWRPYRAAVLAVLLAGCGSPPPDLPNDSVWTSPHFRYHLRQGDESVCSGILDTLEAHFAALTSYLGIEPGEVGMIDYYKFRDEDDLFANGDCRTAEGVACHVHGGGIRSHRKVDQHELIHAYTAHLGHPEPLLAEGLAQVLSCSHVNIGVSAHDWRSAIEDDEDVYNAGAWFVNRLLVEYGPESFVRWYARVPSRDSSEAFRSEFEAAYGLSLDGEYNAALANTPYRTSCLPIWGCSRSALEGDGALRETDGCDDVPDRKFPVAEGVGSDLLANLGFEATGSALRAFPCPSVVAPAVSFASDRSYLSALWPGDYALQQDSGADAALGAQQFLPGWFGDTCERLEPYQLSVERPSRLILPAGGAATHFLRVELPSSSALEIGLSGGTALELYDCPECPGQLSECTRLISLTDEWQPIVLPPRTSFTLAFSQIVAPRGYFAVELTPD